MLDIHTSFEEKQDWKPCFSLQDDKKNDRTDMNWIIVISDNFFYDSENYFLLIMDLIGFQNLSSLNNILSNYPSNT